MKKLGLKSLKICNLRVDKLFFFENKYGIRYINNFFFQFILMSIKKEYECINQSYGNFWFCSSFRELSSEWEATRIEALHWISTLLNRHRAEVNPWNNRALASLFMCALFLLSHADTLF